MKAIAPTVRMPGFRSGKVPPNLIRKMHADALSADALNKARKEYVFVPFAGMKHGPRDQPTRHSVNQRILSFFRQNL